MALLDEGLRRAGILPASTTTATTDPYAAYYEAYGIDPDSSLGKMVLDLIADGELVDEAFDIIADRFNVGPYAPKAPTPSPGRTQFASEAALDTAQAERLRQQSIIEREQLEQQAAIAEADRLAREEENRLAQEAALKRERLGVLQNLVSTFIGAQQSATETLAGLGPRPFRFAAAAQGMPVLGTTPQAGFEQALQGFADRPVPSVDPNAPIGAIEGAIGGLMGQTTPLSPQVFGLAGGGTIPMGTSGTFLVGEKGPEVMDVTPYGVTVRPIQGGFQDGGGVQFDPQTVLQSLLPLYSRLGLNYVPVNQPGGLHQFGTVWDEGIGRRYHTEPWLQPVPCHGQKPRIGRRGKILYPWPWWGVPLDWGGLDWTAWATACIQRLQPQKH
jgi:hypothetical protein